jgi:hypothetical protein
MTDGAKSNSPTAAQRVAMAAVRNGSIRLDGSGCRWWPSHVDISGSALSACQRRGWVDVDPEEHVLYVTEAGLEALR